MMHIELEVDVQRAVMETLPEAFFFLDRKIQNIYQNQSFKNLPEKLRLLALRTSGVFLSGREKSPNLTSLEYEDFLTFQEENSGNKEYLVRKFFVLDGRKHLLGMGTLLRGLENQDEQDDEFHSVGQFRNLVALSKGLGSDFSIRVKNIQHQLSSMHDFTFSKAPSIVQVLKNSVKELQEKTERILDLVRQGKHKKLTTLDLGALVTNVTELFNTRELKSVVLTNRFQRKCWVRGFSEELKNALINVILNGIQAYPEFIEESDKVVEVDLSFTSMSLKPAPGDSSFTFEPLGFGRILVRDKGSGISLENLEKVFEPFFSTRKDAGGIGLGLTLAKNILLGHQGTLEISTVEGGGTEVEILLPQAIP